MSEVHIKTRVRQLDPLAFDDTELGGHVRAAFAHGEMCADARGVAALLAAGDGCQQHPAGSDTCPACGEQDADVTDFPPEVWDAYDELVEFLPLRELRDALKREARLRAQGVRHG